MLICKYSTTAHQFHGVLFAREYVLVQDEVVCECKLDENLNMLSFFSNFFDQGLVAVFCFNRALHSFQSLT